MKLDKARIWSQSIARKHLLGQGSMNPSIAARSLLGERAVRKTERILRRAGRRRTHRGNPLPALTGVLGGLGGLFGGAGRIGKAQEASAAQLVAKVLAGDNRPDPTQKGLTPAQLIELRASLGWHGYDAALAVLHSQQEKQGQEAAARAAREPGAVIGRGLESLGQSPLALGIGTALARGGRSTGYRSRITYDQFGNPRRTRAPLAAGGGAGVSGLRNLATAGVAVGGLAAGYYIGSELNKQLVSQAPNAEEAGVRAALAFRNARAQAAARKGAPLTPAEVRSLGAVYKQQLVALGFDPVTFTRKRNIVERFFTGEEES